MIQLVHASPENRDLLWNIHQKYLYEMTNYYDDEMDDQGNYPYKYFNAYFEEPERKALLIYNDQLLVGFAMINPYSYINESPDYVLAEFTIFPMYRKEHIGGDAANKILETYNKLGIPLKEQEALSGVAGYAYCRTPGVRRRYACKPNGSSRNATAFHRYVSD